MRAYVDTVKHADHETDNKHVKSYPLPSDEAGRLAALRRYAILDTPPTQAFDDLTKLAAEVCGTPVALVSLVDEERQWWTSRYGLDLERNEALHGDSLCAHVMQGTEVVVVRDLLADPRFADAPLAGYNPKFRFYAGAPLVTTDGHALGALCVAAPEPRDLTAGQRAALQSLARQVMAQLEVSRTYQELEEQRRFNAAIVDSTGALVIVSDAEGRIQRFNRTAERILGYSAVEVTGLCFWEVFVRRVDRDRNRRLLEWFAAGRGSLETETEWVTRAGEPRRIAWSLTPLAGQGGAAHRIVATGTDVTEQRRAETWLRQSQERLTFAMEGANDGVWDWNLVTGEVYFSPRWCRMLGYEPEEIAASPDTWAALVHPDDMAGRRERIERHLASETATHYSFEHRVRSKSGAWLWVLDRGKVVDRDASGKPLRMTGTYTDITERKRAELALRESQETLQAFYDSAPMMMGVASIIGDDILHLSNNAATAELFGGAADATQGRLASTIGATREQIAVWLAHYRQSLETGEPVSFQYLHDGPHGARWIAAIVSCLGVGPDGYQRFSYVAQDVTERKAAEEALRRAKEVAEDAARAKSEFLATMSHEIRTPMNGVLGMTGLLLDTQLTSEQREYAETVRSSAEGLLDIINDILDFSKIEAGKLTFERTSFTLRPTIEDAVDLLAESAQQKGLELAILVEPAVPRNVVGDPGRLRQVLLNLLSNAVKFTDRGHVVLRVGLEAWGEGDATIRFDIEDTGIGLSAEGQQRLFQPFSQADGSTTRRYGGTGLGLAISRQLVHGMGGDIGVMSEEGRGSTFWFTVDFPVPEQQSADPPVLDGTPVLCVDDDPIALEHLGALVTALGGAPELVATGAEAIGRLHAQATAARRYACVLVDAAMPEPGGLLLARRVREEPRLADVPVIAVTSWLQRDRARVMHAEGVTASIVKPVRQAYLRDVIERNLPPTVGHVPRPAQQNAAVPKSTEPVRRLRVLVVEDNKVNQQVAARVLAKLGHRADVAANGLEAVDAVQRIAYDVLLMDCHMPELDGFEATIRIRQLEQGARRVPIIAMTASVMQADRDRCFASGMDDFVTKPLEIERLRQVLDRWAGHTARVDPVDAGVLEDLRALQEGDEADLLAELIDLFLGDLPPRCEAIRRGLEAADPQAVRAAAHSLKGSAGNLGARPLAALCQDVEQIARRGSLEGIAALVARIDVEAERVTEYLHAVPR